MLGWTHLQRVFGLLHCPVQMQLPEVGTSDLFNLSLFFVTFSNAFQMR